MCSPLCDQSHLSRSRPSIKRAVTVSCCLFSPPGRRLASISVRFPPVCIRASVFLGHFGSFPRRPQVSHLQYLMWALIRGEELPNMLATRWRRSHTQGPPLIFHRGGRKGRIHHTDRARMERDIPPLSPHTHTHRQRFIVQGFNGALTHTHTHTHTHTFLSWLAHTHTNTHHIFLLLSLFPLSVHLPLLLISLLH